MKRMLCGLALAASMVACRSTHNDIKDSAENKPATCSEMSPDECKAKMGECHAGECKEGEAKVCPVTGQTQP